MKKATKFKTGLKKERLDKLEEGVKNIKLWNPETDSFESLTLMLEDYFVNLSELRRCGQDISDDYIMLPTKIQSANKYAEIESEIIKGKKKGLKSESQGAVFCIIDTNGVAIVGNCYEMAENMLANVEIYECEVEEYNEYEREVEE